jgi:hypothetical protein
MEEEEEDVDERERRGIEDIDVWPEGSILWPARESRGTVLEPCLKQLIGVAA